MAGALVVVARLLSTVLAGLEETVQQRQYSELEAMVPQELHRAAQHMVLVVAGVVLEDLVLVAVELVPMVQQALQVIWSFVGKSNL
jgi:uncharacterized protein involved in cysteine biosynthesis